MKQIYFRLLTLGLVIALVGCISTPPDQKELVQTALEKTVVPSSWQSAVRQGEFDQGALGFEINPALNTLMQEAIAYNADLKIASARVDQSRAALKASAGSLWPSIGLGAQAGTSTIPTSTSAISGAGIIAQWDLDLWGRLRSDQKAAASRFVSAELDATYSKQSIAAQVVKSWIMITEANQQVQLSEKMLAMSKQQVGLIQNGLQVGRNSKQDVALNQSMVQTYENQLLANQQALGNAKRSLEVLLGRYPATQIQAGNTFPKYVANLPAGIPSEILTRRPDIQAAEERFKAAFQDVEAAQRARLPSIRITGGIGYIENSALQLSQALSNPISSLTAQLLMPLFLGGQLQAQVEARSAKQVETMAQYQKTALLALSEVEGGLANDQLLTSRENALSSQVKFMEESVKYTKIQREVGKGDMYQYIQQQLNLASSQSALLRLQSERLMNRVSLHQTLGGKFN